MIVGIMALAITGSLLIGAGAMILDAYNVLTKWE